MMNSNKPPKIACGYLRVSTESQGRDGFGLDLQRIAIKKFAQLQGYDVNSWHKDIYTGTGDGFETRPGFVKAIDKAIEYRCPIIVADIARLCRDRDTMRRIHDLGIPVFSARDGGLPNKVAQEVMAAEAEAEAREISRRTKKGLAPLKAQGKLGNRKTLAAAQAKSREVRSTNSKDFAKSIRPHLAAIGAIDNAGRSRLPYREIAARLTGRNVKTQRGGKWHAKTVGDVLKRLGIKPRPRIDHAEKSLPVGAGTW